MRSKKKRRPSDGQRFGVDNVSAMLGIVTVVVGIVVEAADMVAALELVELETLLELPVQRLVGKEHLYRLVWRVLELLPRAVRE